MIEIIEMSAARPQTTLHSAFTSHADTFLKQLLLLNEKFANDVAKLHSHNALTDFVAREVKNTDMIHLAKSETPSAFVMNACDFLKKHIKSPDQQAYDVVQSALERAKLAAQQHCFNMSKMIISSDITDNTKLKAILTANTIELFNTLADVIAAADRLKRFSDPIKEAEHKRPIFRRFMRKDEQTNYGSMPTMPPSGFVPQNNGTKKSVSNDSDNSGYGTMPTAGFFHGSDSNPSTSGGSGGSGGSQSEYQLLSLISEPKSHPSLLELPPLPTLSLPTPPPPPVRVKSPRKKTTKRTYDLAPDLLTLPSEPVMPNTPKPTLKAPTAVEFKKFKLHAECRRLKVSAQVKKDFFKFLDTQDEGKISALVDALVDPQAKHSKSSLEAAMSQIMQQSVANRVGFRA